MQCPKCKKGVLEVGRSEIFDDHVDIFFECSECEAAFWGRIEKDDIMEE